MEKETVPEKEWYSHMVSAVCSISLISPIGMPSLLNAADQFPHHISSLYFSVHAWRFVFVCALVLAGQGSNGHASCV